MNSTLFMDLYNELCDAIDLINSTFTNHLIVVMINLLTMDVLSAFALMREFFLNSSSIGFYLTIYGLWMFFNFSIKLFMAHAGSSTTREGDKTIVLVTKAGGRMSNNDDLKPDLNSLLLHMRSRSKKLENIFFPINWNLILAVRVK